MTPIERQILENQKLILMLLGSKEKRDSFNYNLTTKRVSESNKLLNKEKSEEPCCEMPNHPLSCECDICEMNYQKDIKEFEKSKDGEFLHLFLYK